MPVPIQDAKASAALVEKFGIKGRMLQQLDEVVVPVAVVADVSDDGPLENGVYQELLATTGVAGEVCLCVFESAPGFVMQPIGCHFTNVAGDTDVRLLIESSGTIPAYTNPLTTQGVRRDGDHGPSPVFARGGSVAALPGQLIAQWLQVRATSNFNSTYIDLTGFEIDTVGDRLIVSCTSANNAINFVPVWTWRRA